MNPRLGKKVFYITQKITGRNYLDALQQLSLSQYFTQEKLLHSQWQRLKKLIFFAFQEVPYYHNLFEKLQIKPEDINNFRDFSEIPILTKRMVRDNFKALHSLSYKKEKYFRYVTSGSTGKPLTIDIEGDAFGYYHAAQYRGFSWYKIFPGDPGVKLWGVPVNRAQKVVEQLKDLSMNRIRFSAFDLSEKQLNNYYQKFQKFKPKYLYGYASALTHFAHFIKEKGIEISQCKPKVVFSTAEKLYPHQKELISSAFDCPVANEYGCAEFGIIAFECPKNHLHISSDNVYLEIINPDSQGVGQVIITGLRNYTMPLIRYQLDDLAKVDVSVCDCEVTLPRIEIMAGRNNDIIKTPEGKIVHSEILAYINRNLEKKGYGLKEFKIIQKAIDLLLVMVVKNNQQEGRIIELLTEQIRENISSQMIVNFEFVEKIPLEQSGKARYFVSEI